MYTYIGLSLSLSAYILYIYMIYLYTHTHCILDIHANIIDIVYKCVLADSHYQIFISQSPSDGSLGGLLDFAFQNLGQTLQPVECAGCDLFPNNSHPSGLGKSEVRHVELPRSSGHHVSNAGNDQFTSSGRIHSENPKLNRSSNWLYTSLHLSERPLLGPMNINLVSDLVGGANPVERRWLMFPIYYWAISRVPNKIYCPLTGVHQWRIPLRPLLALQKPDPLRRW